MEPLEPMDLELIAAFIDGRLSGAERERVVKLLGESEAAFEIYAGAMGARADIGGGVSVIPLVERRSRPRRWWIAAVPVAAAAALLIAVLPRMQGRGAELDMSASILRPLISPSPARPLIAQSTAGPSSPAELAVALGHGWSDQGWSVMRGAGAALVDSTSALRLGVRAADLQVAFVLRDRERAGRITAEMIELLRLVDLSDSQRADYDAIQARIASGDSLEQIATAASGAEQSLGEFLDSRWFGLGKWFAAGELAARAHSTSFFASRRTKEFLESAIADMRLAPDDVALLRQVATPAANGLSEADFERSRNAFAELIRRHGG